MTVAIALAAGYFLDLLLGDPPWLPHPVVAIGRVISWLERIIRGALPKTEREEKIGGAILVGMVLMISFVVSFTVLSIAYRIDYRLGVLFECVICYQVLATKCLRDAGALVYKELERGDLPAARRAVARIVGRDTAALDAPGVTRATVETVAENSSDGVVAPMLYFAIGGAPLALAYKAVNTMDSMVGYRNERYRYFGSAAARLDDAANFIPARLTGVLLIAAAALACLDWKNALHIWKRDSRNHASPNAGHPESACAGALGVQLGGDSWYEGKLASKPTIGDALRNIVPEDIPRANRLLYFVSGLCFLLCLIIALLMP